LAKIPETQQLKLSGYHAAELIALLSKALAVERYSGTTGTFTVDYPQYTLRVSKDTHQPVNHDHITVDLVSKE
jgi:hypothetical protein